MTQFHVWSCQRSDFAVVPARGAGDESKGALDHSSGTAVRFGVSAGVESMMAASTA